jgi:hypothetical protein
VKGVVSTAVVGRHQGLAVDSQTAALPKSMDSTDGPYHRCRPLRRHDVPSFLPRLVPEDILLHGSGDGFAHQLVDVLNGAEELDMYRHVVDMCHPTRNRASRCATAP